MLDELPTLTIRMLRIKSPAPRAARKVQHWAVLRTIRFQNFYINVTRVVTEMFRRFYNYEAPVLYVN